MTCPGSHWYEVAELGFELRQSGSRVPELLGNQRHSKMKAERFQFACPDLESSCHSASPYFPPLPTECGSGGGCGVWKLGPQGDTIYLIPAENTLAWIATSGLSPAWQVSLDSPCSLLNSLSSPGKWEGWGLFSGLLPKLFLMNSKQTRKPHPALFTGD